MPLDPEVSDSFKSLIVSDAKNSSGLTQMADRNLSQGLGVIQNTLIQANGAVSDDPAIFGALNTAAGVPQSGFVKGT